MPQFIFTMKDLRKVTPQGKEILKGIWLSFYGDAKIGVLGANGAGKSTLLRIMAGVDKDFAGEAFPAEGTRIGYLPQEPQLDPKKNVLEHVEEAVAEKRKILQRYEEISANYSDDTADEFSRLQDQIDAQNLWDLDEQVELAMDALRLPPGTPTSRRSPAARSAGSRSAACCCSPRHAAARRAHEPPRRGVGGLARALPEGLPRLRRRHHPRPLLPRQRGGLDPGARPRGRHSLGGQLLVLARAEGPAAHAGGEGSVGPPPDRSSASWSGSAWPPAPARPRARPASRGTRRCWPRSRRRRSATTSARSRSRPGPASATSSSTRRACARATATTC